MIICPKFNETQKMFCGKFVMVAKVQLVIEIQTVNIDVNVVDVNVTTRSKATNEQVFKDRESSSAID
jgi:hypothetical protein